MLDEPEYIRALLTTSACLVTQKPGVGANFLPSKLLPALATGTPVLAACEPSSPLGQEVTDGAFGQVVSPGDAPSLAATLHKWKNESGLLATLGAKARERANLYLRERILSQYEAELLHLVSRA